jgi:hypothetical protein
MRVSCRRDGLPFCAVYRYSRRLLFSRGEKVFCDLFLGDMVGIQGYLLYFLKNHIVLIKLRYLFDDLTVVVGLLMVFRGII